MYKPPLPYGLTWRRSPGEAVDHLYYDRKRCCNGIPLTEADKGDRPPGAQRCPDCSQRYGKFMNLCQGLGTKNEADYHPS
jgi:hypothetical protein